MEVASASAEPGRTWNSPHWTADDIGPDFAPMLDAMRVFHHRLAGARLPDDLTEEMRGIFERLGERLLEHQVPEERQIAGRIDIPGRGQLLVPNYELDAVEPDFLAGRLTYGRHFLGRNGAVYGGAIPLLFDSVLGRLANGPGRPASRTAYLHVDYRSITPIETELRFTAEVARQEGRKRFIRGTLSHGGTLCADVDALFLVLRPHQR
ncbi:acyl-coenzyme A thioesterase PaaI-like protein [Actinocorallia herbida]|uniref:Acyl-coenzyme A thioesterase THEM4 n=1 Tax=Actinocorallia herbida TaxID=58109 RepID=A0A3N1CUV2_9ACTN|nr:PaaI family thioesterase [Actinocorallia herbida]ROO85083.1 acyl-coenzyme A thioesterase PaaI-like protein [Actinocorallia herbida]